MKQYTVTAEETNIVEYFIRAENEDDARQAFSNGEWDDYKTVESTHEGILSVEEDYA